MWIIIAVIGGLWIGSIYLAAKIVFEIEKKEKK